MTLFKNKFRIESTRLKGYDYSQAGEYFVTICTDNHRCLFGAVIEEEMRSSPVGKIAKSCWEKIPKHFRNVELDEFVIMPNHVHGIIIINDNRRDVQLNVSTDRINISSKNDLNASTELSPKRGTLSVIIRTYKAAVTTECRRKGYNEFQWQSRFYEHIIRDEKDLQSIREYIINNPIKWFSDEENPDLGKSANDPNGKYILRSNSKTNS
jgi:REP element-mobilizing transposase RayT